MSTEAMGPKAGAVPDPVTPSTPPAVSPPPKRPPAGRRRIWRLLAALVLLVVAAVLGFPRVREALTTVSTDDAYVNGHVTFVAPRVAGPGRARAGRRQQPRPQGRPARPTRQGALPDQVRHRPGRRRRRPGGSRRRPGPGRGPSWARRRAARFNLAARHRRRQQPDRPAPRSGRHARIAEGDARPRPRPTTTAPCRWSRPARSPQRIRSPQGGPASPRPRSRRRCRPSTRSASRWACRRSPRRRRPRAGPARSRSDLLLRPPGPGRTHPGRLAARRRPSRSNNPPSR